jgi:hypothetical protein
MNIWIGSEYQRSGRVLILGESWYSEVVPLSDYVQSWAFGELQDSLFARLYNSLSGRRREASTISQRLEWWQSVAFYNFVPGSLGPTNDQRPTSAQFRAARAPLRSVLDHLNPAGVWIVGLGQAEYSRSVVDEHGAACIVVRHPRSGISALKLNESWRTLHAVINRDAKSS